MLVVDIIALRLLALGVRHVFGVGGANIEDLFSAIQRRRPQIRAILCKHEHAAGAAADAYARLTGDLGVVMVTSGGATMNLVHALAEARASGTPVLAFAGEPPRELQGRGAFQDSSGQGGTIDGAAVLSAIVRRCIRVERPHDVGPAIDAALEAVRGPEPGPAVILLAKDLQRAEGVSSTPSPVAYEPSQPDAEAIQRAVARLPPSPLVIAGASVARRHAQAELAYLVDRCNATVAVTPDGRDAFDNTDARFLGVIGSMTHEPVTRALTEARGCVVVGARLSLHERMGIESLLRDKPMVSLGGLPPHVGPADVVHVAGDVLACVRAFTDALPRSEAPVRGLIDRVSEPNLTSDAELTLANVLRRLSRRIPDESTILVDAGNTGAAAIHHLQAPRRGRWLVAMGMAGMGWTFGAAIGAAYARGHRCFVVAGDGAFYMHGMEIHTAIEHDLPVTYVVLNNAAHGMCLVRERLLLRENTGYNTFRRARIGSAMGVMFPSLAAFECSTLAEFEQALEASATTAGPVLISVALHDVEIPPFVGFRSATPPGATKVDREVGEGP